MRAAPGPAEQSASSRRRAPAQLPAAHCGCIPRPRWPCAAQAQPRMGPHKWSLQARRGPQVDDLGLDEPVIRRPWWRRLSVWLRVVLPAVASVIFITVAIALLVFKNLARARVRPCARVQLGWAMCWGAADNRRVTSRGLRLCLRALMLPGHRPGLVQGAARGARADRACAAAQRFVRSFELWRWAFLAGVLFPVWWLGDLLTHILVRSVEAQFLTTRNVLYFMVAVRVRARPQPPLPRGRLRLAHSPEPQRAARLTCFGMAGAWELRNHKRRIVCDACHDACLPVLAGHAPTATRLVRATYKLAPCWRHALPAAGRHSDRHCPRRTGVGGPSRKQQTRKGTSGVVVRACCCAKARAWRALCSACGSCPDRVTNP